MEVIIVGAGPAGTSAAIMLAQWGHQVLLFDRRRLPRDHVGESLPPKVEPVLARLGLLERVATFGFVRSEATAVYAGEQLERHAFDPRGRMRGYQVTRREFDQLLLERAQGLGVRVEQGARVRSLIQDDGRIRGVTVHGRPHRADWVVDASGSARLAARQLGLLERTPVRTVAMTAYWKRCRRPVDFDAHDTVFEMLPEAWVWSVLRRDGTRNLTVGLDATRTPGGRRALEELYHREVRQSVLLAPLIEDAECVTPVRPVDATTTQARVHAQAGLLLAGDASAFVDPLTSQGVTKALHSGVAAALVINTSALQPQDEGWACDWYDRSERHLAERYAEVAARFHRASPFVEHDFWKRRVPDVPADARDSSERALAFRDALEARGGTGLTVRKVDALEARPVTVVGEDRLMRKLGFAVNDQELAAQHVDAEFLLALLDGRTVDQVFEAYGERSAEVIGSELGRRLMSTLMALAERDWLSWQVPA